MFTFWPLGVLLLSAFSYKFPVDIGLPVSGCTPRLRIPCFRGACCLLRNCQTVCRKPRRQVTCPAWRSRLPRSLTSNCYCLLCDAGTLVGVRRNLLTALMCVSIVMVLLGISSCAYWPFVYLFREMFIQIPCLVFKCV